MAPGKEDAPPSQGGVLPTEVPAGRTHPQRRTSACEHGKHDGGGATRLAVPPASASADANRSARSRGGVMSFRRPVAGARPNHLGFRATAILLRNVIEATTPPSQRMSMPVR